MSSWVIFLTCLLSVPCLFPPEVACQTGAEAKALRQKLFVTDAYDEKIRPKLNQNSPVYVSVDFNLLALNGVDEAQETIQTTGFLDLDWTDEFLTWNMSDFGNIQYTQYPQSDVWTPDIALKNSFLEYKPLGVSKLNVRVTYAGRVTWQPFQVFQSTCSIDITYFPFDQQICSLNFVAWSYRKWEVYVRAGASGIVMDEYQASSQWDIPSTRWYLTENTQSSSITFEMTLKRKPLYNILTIVFPVILLGCLNLLVFAIPCSSGEKSGYAITVFLAFAVFLTIIESSFPKNSETVSYFAIYVIVQTSQSTLITFIALFMIRYSQSGGTAKVPKTIVFLAKLGKFRCVSKKRLCSKVGVVSAEGVEKKADLVEAMKATTGGEGETDDDEEEEYTKDWAMNGLDNLCFVFFSCLLLAVTMGCIFAAFVEA